MAAAMVEMAAAILYSTSRVFLLGTKGHAL